MVGDATHHLAAGRPAGSGRTARRRLPTVSAVAAGAVSLALVVGLAAGCSASSDVSATSSPTTAKGGTTTGTGTGTTGKVGAGVGSLVPDPDHPGELITLDGETTTTTTAPPTVTTAAPPTVVTAPPTTATPPTAPPTTAPPTTTPPTTKPPTTTTTAPTTKPVITKFDHPETVTCKPDTYTIKLSWETKNTTKVEIGIANPGKYKEYKPVDSDDFPFPCGSPDQSSQTYYLTAFGTDGTTTQQKVIVAKAP